MHLSLPRRFPLFVLVSSICSSLQCLISALTQGGGGGHLFRLTCSVVLWGGRNTTNKYHWCVLTVSWPHWVCPHSQHVCFPCLPCLGSRLLCWELSEASPGLYALPRSKPLRFRLSGTPQRRRLGWACVLCPSQVRAAQVTRCLASALSQVVSVSYSPPRSQLLSFLGVEQACLLRWAMCLFWGADLWLQPSWWMSTIQNPKKCWLAMKPACSLAEGASLGPQLPPSGSGCPRLPVSSGGWAVRSQRALLSPLFCERAWQCLRLGLSWDSYPTVWVAISS